MIANLEFSRPYDTDKIGRETIEQKIEANPTERAALAKRFQLPEIPALSASCKLRRDSDQVSFLVEGLIKAKVTQLCVVSAEPFTVEIEEPLKVRFLPPGLYTGETAENILSEWDFEPLEYDVIDLGELAAQHLFLALDPYPRKPGTAPVSLPAEGLEEVKTPSPFAILQKIKQD